MEHHSRPQFGLGDRLSNMDQRGPTPLELALSEREAKQSLFAKSTDTILGFAAGAVAGILGRKLLAYIPSMKFEQWFNKDQWVSQIDTIILAAAMVFMGFTVGRHSLKAAVDERAKTKRAREAMERARQSFMASQEIQALLARPDIPNESRSRMLDLYTRIRSEETELKESDAAVIARSILRNSPHSLPGPEGA